MLSDDYRAVEKVEELVRTAEQAIDAYCNLVGVDNGRTESQGVAEELIKSFANVTPPENESQLPRTAIGFVTFDRVGWGGAKSTKPGNIFLSFGKLVNTIAASGLAAAGALQMPLAVPFAALVVWKLFWSNATVDITEREAAVIWTMWLHRSAADTVPDDRLLDLVNLELQENGRSPCTRRELDDSLKNLTQLKCIERSRSDKSNWWLREWVKVNYT